MFRLTPKVPAATSKGPLLFIHGMFSDPLDFLESSDPTTPSAPLQLAAEGYDVWIGCTRGRDITIENANYDKNIPEQSAAYWDYTFAEIGKEDVASMVDEIIIQRPKTCEKVQIVAHGTGVNSVLVGASDAVMGASF